MGAYVYGTYVPSIGETGWGDELNAWLTAQGRESVNVMEAPYGAANDGTGIATNAAAIQAAADAMAPVFGTVVFPPGTYALADGATLNMPSGVNYVARGYVNIETKNAYAFTAGANVSNMRMHGFATSLRSGSTSGGAIKTTGHDHNGWDISNVHGGGTVECLDPMFRMEGHIGTRMSFCTASFAPVGYYWSPGGWFSNSNTMYRCRGVPGLNANTFDGINACLYVDSVAAFKAQDCIFESAYTGYGTYVKNSNSVTIENIWYEANLKDNVHIVDCGSVRIENCKFHYQSVGDATADHIEIENTRGAGFREDTLILGNYHADPSTSGVYLRIGTNVEGTVVIGNRDLGSTDVVDNGTRSVLEIKGAGTAGGGFYVPRLNVGAYSATGATPGLMSGTGSPESSVTAPIGSLYMRRDGGAGTSLYVKQSGTGNTGWVGK